MSMTTYLENKLLDHVFDLAAWTAPSPAYLSLLTVVPGDDGSVVEVSTVGTGYARQSMGSKMGSADSGVSATSSAIDFGTAATNWGTIVAVGVHDAATSGNLLLYGATAEPKLVYAGLPFQLAAGQLAIQFD